MVSSKHVSLPAILIANDLRDGDVVFCAATGWTRDLAGAVVAEDLLAAAKLESRGRAGLADNEIVDPGLVVVTLENGAPKPTHIRELMRARGPSTRPDLGKQVRLVAEKRVAE